MENIEEIKDIANYCLNCRAKPCTKACPMNTRIPEFIQKIKEEDYKDAYNILHENNKFSYICSLICPQEEQCQGSCVRGIKSEPTQIGKLERFVNEWAIENNYFYEENNINERNLRKVAIIGSGPAGLSASIELLKQGYDVTIFEKEKLAGGLLRYGIPDFRLSKEKVDRIINLVISLGGKFIFNKELGKDISIKDLKDEYDYIFLGIGAEIPSTYKLSDKKLNGIYKSDYFLKEYSEGRYIQNLGDVVVIGGGNVAIDCARSAVKMGAKSVSILYRRDEENMPARKIELQDAISDGVKIKYKTKVIEAISDNNSEKITSVKCMKTNVIEKKAVDIENSEFIYPANTVIFAIGLKPNKILLEKEGIELNEYGMPKVNECFMTSIDGVYAGGDILESKSTVCRALAMGRNVAKEIIKLNQNA